MVKMAKFKAKIVRVLHSSWKESRRMPRLKFHISDSIAEIFQLTDDCTIGRTAVSDIVLLDSSISRRHCRIFKMNGQYHVADLGSGNGTYVNGERIAEVTTLASEDIIQVGAKDLVFDGYDIDIVPPLHTVDLTKKPLASFKDEVLIESADVLFIIPTIEPLIEMVYEIASRNIYVSKLPIESQDRFIPAVISAMENAAKHGNRYEVSKLLKFRCVKNEKRVVVQIIDQGKGFDWKEKLRIGLEIMKDPRRCNLFINREVEPSDPYMGKIGSGLMQIIKNVPSVEFNQVGNAIALNHLI